MSVAAPAPSPPRNDSVLRALRREPCAYTPVWVMRQAGRYLPEYRKLRDQAGSFMKLSTTPKLAAEVTLQPLRRFPLDAAIIFSDILTLPDAMGMGLEVLDGVGPVFKKPIQSLSDIQRLEDVCFLAELDYVAEAIERVVARTDCSVIGFAGSPLALACYMIGSKSHNEQRLIRQWLHTRPHWLRQLLSILENAVTEHLLLQLKAGAHCLMLFDSWGGQLSHAHYQEFSYAPLQAICERVLKRHPHVPLVVFARGAGTNLGLYQTSAASAVAIDWAGDLSAVREQLGARMAIQGNLDPACLLADEAHIRREVRAVLERYGPYHGHVFNLGHGIWENAPPQNLGYMVEEVHRYSQTMRQQHSFL